MMAEKARIKQILSLGQKCGMTAEAERIALETDMSPAEQPSQPAKSGLLGQYAANLLERESYPGEEEEPDWKGPCPWR